MLKKRRSQLTMFVALCTSVFVLSACVPVTREAASPYAGEEPAAHGEAHDAPHWGYTGDTGPAYWGDLNPAYILCETGTSQSPINIDEVDQVDLANIAIHYEPSKVKFINNGHTIEGVYGEGSYIDLDGVRYNLEQFHFHAPSEHEVGGELAALEVHFVHKNAEGNIAVLGVLFQEGSDSRDLLPMAEALSKMDTPELNSPVTFNAADLLPADQSTFRYSGSLTTPPCTEGVTWLVMVQQPSLTQQQISAFTSIYDGNNRPVQPLNGREIDEDVTP